MSTIPLRWVWMALAAVDAIALAWLAWKFDWVFDEPRVGPTPLGFIIIIILWVLLLGTRLLALAFMAAVAYAISRDLLGAEWLPRRWVAFVATLPLLGVIATAAFLAAYEVRDALHKPALAFADRLLVFDRLAEAHEPGQSLGAFLCFLAVAAYLGEKYLLRWWRLRWPLSIVALGILAWPAWHAIKGERVQRERLAAQEWKPIAPKKTWLEAVSACEALGSEWRLPRSPELSAYFASAPEAVRDWKGVAWTNTMSDAGRNAIVVELAPRRQGYFRSNEHPWRGRSLCELDTGRSAKKVDDWFTDLRPRLCTGSADYPGMHISTVQLLADITGRSGIGGPSVQYLTRQREAAAICIKPSSPEILLRRDRAYPTEEEFRSADAFLARMGELCSRQPRKGEAGACAAFAQ